MVDKNAIKFVYTCFQIRRHVFPTLQSIILITGGGCGECRDIILRKVGFEDEISSFHSKKRS
jgi:hypothetical protein